MTPTKYTKKPVTIEAMQLTGPEACSAAVNWIEDSTGKPGIAAVAQGGDGIHIGTLEGLMDASPGDFVIKGVRGEFYPCKPDIFAATYTAAASTSPTAKALRKLNDTRSLFVIAALAISLIAAVARLFAEPGRPAVAVAADLTIITLIVVINVFSMVVVFRASKAILTEDEFVDVRRAAYNVKHPNDAEQGETTREMTPDELERAGLPRDFHGAA